MHKHILLIEPLHDIRTILEVYLQLAGHTVITLPTYETVSEPVFFSQHQSPDLVFVSLPPSQPKSGSLLQRLRSHYPDTVLVAMIYEEEYAHCTVQTMMQETRAVPLIKPFLLQDVFAISGVGQSSYNLPVTQSKLVRPMGWQ